MAEKVTEQKEVHTYNYTLQEEKPLFTVVHKIPSDMETQIRLEYLLSETQVLESKQTVLRVCMHQTQEQVTMSKAVMKSTSSPVSMHHIPTLGLMDKFTEPTSLVFPLVSKFPPTVQQL